jgi:hypothetical protein
MKYIKTFENITKSFSGDFKSDFHLVSDLNKFKDCVENYPPDIYQYPLRLSCYYAVETDDTSAIDYLYKSGVDLKFRNNYPAKIAAQYGGVKLLQYLFDKLDWSNKLSVLETLSSWCRTSDKIDDAKKRIIMDIIDQKIKEVKTT